MMEPPTEQIELSEDYIDDLLTKLARFTLAEQLARQRAGRIVGQAFTNWSCLLCKKPDTHHNTGVPLLCKPCERILAAISLREDRVQPAQPSR